MTMHSVLLVLVKDVKIPKHLAESLCFTLNLFVSTKL